MDVLLSYIKKCIPKALFKKLQPFYHYVLNFTAAVVYGFPSRKMIVIGVTGTTGKTTVVYMLAQMLKHSGKKVGYTSTAMFGDGEKEWLNDKKMTMLGRFFTQSMLSRMVRNGCDIAIVETTSEGAVQFRHKFINYDIFLFTGLYPEHIDSHGSFDNYKNAKLELFRHLAASKIKPLFPSKAIVAHGDDEHAVDFLDFSVGQKLIYAQDMQSDACKLYKDDDRAHVLQYTYTGTTRKGVEFDFDGEHVALKLLGEFTAANASAALSVGRALSLSDEKIIKGIEKIAGIPGRLERIEGKDFSVIVDYAFEPVAVTKLYETVSLLKPRKVIHVLGSCGGGRDLERRGALGRIAGKEADLVIVTNEDPYDDDPMGIIEDVAQGAREVGKEDDVDLFLIEDRKQAIEKAIEKVREGGIVLVTGKGSEQAIAVANGHKIPWDDREVVRNALAKK